VKYRGFAADGIFRYRSAAQQQEHDMRWETPRAIDVRFGMEITMYIARR
jgi:coenzyme PQQ precursor peptide PqqA